MRLNAECRRITVGRDYAETCRRGGFSHIDCKHRAAVLHHIVLASRLYVPCLRLVETGVTRHVKTLGHRAGRIKIHRALVEEFHQVPHDNVYLLHISECIGYHAQI